MLRLQLLGGFQVSAVEKPIARLQSERLQALLAYLVLHRDQPLARQQIAVTFWPDTTDAQAGTNLRTLIARLREALPDIDQLFTFDAQTVQWRSDAPAAIEVIEFEEVLSANRMGCRHIGHVFRKKWLEALLRRLMWHTVAIFSSGGLSCRSKVPAKRCSAISTRSTPMSA